MFHVNWAVRAGQGSLPPAGQRTGALKYFTVLSSAMDCIAERFIAVKWADYLQNDWAVGLPMTVLEPRQPDKE